MEKITQIVVTLRVDVAYDTDKANVDDVKEIVSRRASDLNAHTIEQSVRIDDVSVCDVSDASDDDAERDVENVVVYDDERKLVFVNGERFEFVSNTTGGRTCERCAFDRRPCNSISCVDVAKEWGYKDAYLVRTNRKE